MGIVTLFGACGVFAAVGYRRHLDDLHRFERAARRAAEIGVVAREQYIHEAHTIIVGDRSHLAHHDAWVRRFYEDIAAFRADLGGEQLSHLDAIATLSRELARVFEVEIVPGVAAHDEGRVRVGHDRAIALVEEMTAHSDALESYFEARAGDAADRARRSASTTLALSVVASAAAAIMAAVVARRVWRDFSVPIERLARVAGRVSAGDHDARIGKLEAEELAVVGHAFDGMLDSLAAQRAELSAAERLAAIGRVAAGVAHEINNPIAVIRGYVKTMQEEAPNPQLASELSILDEEAAACQRIAEDLLAYTRSPALSRKPTAISLLIEDVVTRTLAQGAGDVRADVEPATLDIDPLRVRQVVTNIVRNALQAGTGAPVEITGRRRGHRYEIVVEDRGPGVAPELRDRLFEPFFTTRPSGVGLGLAVSYGLVAAHGGTIRADERVGGGLSVVIELPVEAP